ncbi:MAG TPA: GNAT family N-acetyltransferase [Treponema sp.]|nr:GNAT family N-acetyltransferase [Treponema sp.]
MEFELTPEIIDEIIFSMEDQTNHFLFDSTECLCVPENSENAVTGHSVFDDGNDRYYAIPGWESISGFRMMERFVSQLRNPLARESLRVALSSGQGVFRNFKNILRERPEIERMWYYFKEREMRAIVFEWYNSLRDFWGLERIGAEPEETDEILSQDFTFRLLQDGEETEFSTLIEAMRQEVFEEMPIGLGEAMDVLWQRIGGGSSLDDKTVLVVESLDGELVGIAVSATLPESGVLCAHICVLFVLPSFRGMGIGKELLARTVAHWTILGFRWLVFSVSPIPKVFFPVLHRAGFIEKGHLSVLDLSEIANH